MSYGLKIQKGWQKRNLRAAGEIAQDLLRQESTVP
jgi:hypothetical protein